jgi:hypothetical protein
MILSLKSGIANIAYKSALDSVLNDMLFHKIALWKCHLTFRTTVKDCSVKGGFFTDFTGLKI